VAVEPSLFFIVRDGMRVFAPPSPAGAVYIAAAFQKVFSSSFSRRSGVSILDFPQMSVPVAGVIGSAWFLYD